MTTELATKGADSCGNGTARSTGQKQLRPQLQQESQQSAQMKEQQQRSNSVSPTSNQSMSSPPSNQSTSNRCPKDHPKCSSRRPCSSNRLDYVSSLRCLSIEDGQATSIGCFRSNRCTQMAYLEDIPKYAFGTSHSIETSNKSTNDNNIATTVIQDLNDNQLGTTTNTTDKLETWCKEETNMQLEVQQHDQPRISENEFKSLVFEAIRIGCRHFDCAPLYGTQRLVGECFSETMKQVPRQKLFVTSKLPPNMMQTEHIVRSITNSVKDLQCCYLDLFLIHAPFATKYVADDVFYPVDECGRVLLDESESVLENAWRKLVELKRRGFTRYIGLSNVNIEQLDRLHAIHPVNVVQNEYHIYNQNRDLFDHCEEINVHFEAYACFGNPTKSRLDSKPNCFDDPVLNRVAKSNKLSVAQTIIQWIHNQPLSYVIKCDNQHQLNENLLATKLDQLPVENLMELDSLDKRCRVHTFTEHKGLVKHREYPFNSSDQCDDTSQKKVLMDLRSNNKQEQRRLKQTERPQDSQSN